MKSYFIVYGLGFVLGLVAGGYAGHQYGAKVVEIYGKLRNVFRR